MRSRNGWWTHSRTPDTRAVGGDRASVDGAWDARAPGRHEVHCRGRTRSSSPRFPAELQDQARAFYGDRGRVDRVLDLASQSMWAVRPNGHLSWWLAAPDRRWYFADGALDASQYMRQWQTDLGHVHSYQRDAVVTELCPWLLRRGYVGDPDRTLMEDFVARLPRPDAHLRPGVAVSRRWSLEEVNRLQTAGELTSAIREAVDTLLDTLGEPPLPS